ncbi:hypothetical protein Dda_5987 [Drechslerella dactyloides]|uniref:Uncharacterized protein n=1 Tax=Drechslerella dactyloides TaxID=74499 RepID=A0AAD6NI35_DREDA|nr:hypothetical protein Dda_5987 [Drechslerella dactyloides]
MENDRDYGTTDEKVIGEPQPGEATTGLDRTLYILSLMVVCMRNTADRSILQWGWLILTGRAIRS